MVFACAALTHIVGWLQPFGVVCSALDFYSCIFVTGGLRIRNQQRKLFSTQCLLSRMHLLAVRTILSATV